MIRGRGAILLLVLSAVLPNPHLQAQDLFVSVTEAESGSPILGAWVTLLSPDDARVRSALTNDRGRFVFRSLLPGSYRVRVEVIGREAAESELVELAPDAQERVDMALRQRAIELPGIEVEGSGRCELPPQEAQATQAVWDQVRQALEIQAWGSEGGRFRFRVLRYRQDLDPSGGTVRSRDQAVAEWVGSNPIRSLPAEDLAREGYVRPLDDGGYQYLGPDASALLSGAFLDTHCLRLVRDRKRPELIGLRFEPVPKRRKPDIEGTLWVDRQSLLLRHLEYRYTWSPWLEAQGVAQGRIEFETLANGLWIIRRWWIRMPMMAQDRTLVRMGALGLGVMGIREEGGEVVQVTTLDRKIITEV